VIALLATMAACDGEDQGSEVCDALLACVGEVDPDRLPSLVGAYGGTGTCWGDETTEAACNTACESGLQEYQRDHPDEPACDGVADTGPWDPWTFDAGTWTVTYTGVVHDTCDVVDPDDPGTDTAALVQGTWPDFTLALTVEFELDCELDGEDYGCSPREVDDISVQHWGSFDSDTSGSGRSHVEDEACSRERGYGLSWEGEGA